MNVCSRALILVVLLCAAAPPSVQAAQELPPYWMALSVRGALLDAGPQARPPTTIPNPLAVVGPGETIRLRAKIVGGRRAYMMWPDTYANIGPHTVINSRGMAEMSFTIDTGAFHGTGQWTVTEEKYTWNAGGRGILNVVTGYDTGEKVDWTAPNEEGFYPITVQGSIKFKYVRHTPAGRSESSDNAEASATFNIQVKAGAGAPVTQEPDFNQAMQKILPRYQALGEGPESMSLPTYVVSPGFLNNVYSVFNDTNDEYVCGGWQGKVLDMLDAMRQGTPEERALFQNLDYGPIQAYYGGHQAVVVYPKGTDWRQTGTVLDPWPNQRPETFTIQDWEKRFWFGVGPSSVWENQYPLTGGSNYPTKHLRITKKHMPILRRCTPEQRRQYQALPTQAERDAFIEALPDSLKKSTAVAVHSPVQMLVVDGMGRRVGWESPTSFVYEIPGTDVDA
ncbi:MAG: hypothetical protein J7M38_02775, partial [Armatimonadetes bacterium]|nr:hypothetical protein [Armatimonadota bacterium]